MSELPTVDEMAVAIDAALTTYDNNQTWASGELLIEYAEAGGYMGSDSAFKPIDHVEFAGRVLAQLEKLNVK